MSDSNDIDKRKMSRSPKIIQLSNAYIRSKIFSLIQERQHGKCRSCGIRFEESNEIVSCGNPRRYYHTGCAQ
jgi:hypothetical protein